MCTHTCLGQGDGKEPEGRGRAERGFSKNVVWKKGSESIMDGLNDGISP